jgi:hypothetical protein
LYVVIAFTSNSYYAFQEMSRRQSLEICIEGILNVNSKSFVEIVERIEEIEEKKLSSYDEKYPRHYFGY